MPVRRAAGAGAKVPHEERNLQTHPQTRAKLDGYADYLPRYLGKLGNSAKRVFVNDLFAGSGRVRDGMAWADGSPLIACRAAAKAAADFAARGRAVIFSLRFVEPNEESRATLESLVAPFCDEIDIVVLPGKAGDHLAAIVAECARYPTITFLDPDGFGVTFEQVVAFGDRSYSEVLLNFDVQGVLRTAGIVETRAVTNFCGGDWWQAYRRNGLFDEDGFLAEYGRRLGEHYNYVSAQRLDFPEVTANRAIAQGAYSVKGIDLWRQSIRRAMPKNASITFDFVSQLDRSAQIDGVIARLGALTGQPCYFGVIRRALGIFAAEEPEIHQALYFLRERGLVSWTSTLHVASTPAPVFTFGELPTDLRWDEIERPPEQPNRRGSLVASRR